MHNYRGGAIKDKSVYIAPIVTWGRSYKIEMLLLYQAFSVRLKTVWLLWYFVEAPVRPCCTLAQRPKRLTTLLFPVVYARKLQRKQLEFDNPPLLHVVMEFRPFLMEEASEVLIKRRIPAGPAAGND